MFCIYLLMHATIIWRIKLFNNYRQILKKMITVVWTRLLEFYCVIVSTERL